MWIGIYVSPFSLSRSSLVERETVVVVVDALGSSSQINGTSTLFGQLPTVVRSKVAYVADRLIISAMTCGPMMVQPLNAMQQYIVLKNNMFTTEH